MASRTGRIGLSPTSLHTLSPKEDEREDGEDLDAVPPREGLPRESLGVSRATDELRGCNVRYLCQLSLTVHESMTVLILDSYLS